MENVTGVLSTRAGMRYVIVTSGQRGVQDVDADSEAFGRLREDETREAPPSGGADVTFLGPGQIADCPGKGGAVGGPTMTWSLSPTPFCRPPGCWGSFTIRALADSGHDVTVVQFRALDLLGHAGPQRLVSLAEMLGVQPSVATRLCDRLVAKELIVRLRSDDDRREVSLSSRPRVKSRPGW